MPVSVVHGHKVWQRRDRATALKHWLGWIVGVCLFMVCWRIIAGATNWFFVWDAPRQGSEFFGRLFPPEWSYVVELGRPFWDTLNMATLGTLISVVIALPIAVLTARNTTPHPLLRSLGLLIIVVSRSVNSLIWALLLVAILGPGVLAGVLAIALRSIGFVGKLFYEAIEEVNPAPIEAITATGASPTQILSYAILPQVLPSLVGVSVFRWDINLRESTVIGLVGAGGLGLQLDAAVNALQWPRASLIFLVILLLVLLSEATSARVRRSIT